MSNYKLTYFNLTALGEPIRFLLHYGGVKFVDERIELDDWPKYKSVAPMEQLPVLEIDGKKYHQSLAICRYLGRKFNLAGANELEALAIDAIADSITDLRLAVAKYYMAPDAQQKANLKAETLTKVAFYLNKFEKIIKENGGFFVGGKLSWADVLFAAISGMLSTWLESDITEGRPIVKNLVDKVLSLPNIKNYVATRPTSKF